MQSLSDGGNGLHVGIGTLEDGIVKRQVVVVGYHIVMSFYLKLRLQIYALFPTLPNNSREKRARRFTDRAFCPNEPCVATERTVRGD